MYKIFFNLSATIFISTFWFASLNGQTTLNISLKSASAIDYKQVVDLSTISYIRLETNDNSLIGNDFKVRHNDSIVVLISNKIIVFSISGKHLFSIDKRGKGPGEYLSLTDIQIINNTNFLILDRRGKKILQIDSNGSTIKTIPIDLHGLAFEFINQSTLAIYSGSDWTDSSKDRLNFFDLKSQKIVKSLFPISQNEYQWRYFQGIQNFQKSEEDLFFYMDCKDTIFSVSQDRLQPAIILNFGENKMPPKYIQREYASIRDFVTLVERENMIYNIIEMNITDKHCSIGFREKKNYYHFISNPRGSAGRLINNYQDFLGFEKLSMVPNFDNFPRFWNDELSYIIIEPTDFMDKDDFKIPSNVTSKLGIVMGDNPIIVTFKYRDEL